MSRRARPLVFLRRSSLEHLVLAGHKQLGLQRVGDAPVWFYMDFALEVAGGCRLR
jgi:hypothetical protein